MALASHASAQNPLRRLIGGHEGVDRDLHTVRLRVIRRRLRRLQCMECEKRLLDWPGLVAWLLTMAAGYPRRWRRYGITGTFR